MTLEEYTRYRLVRKKIRMHGVARTRELLKPSGWWDADCKMWDTFLKITGEKKNELQIPKD